MFLFNTLKGDKGQPQTGTETIDKLCDRVSHATLLEDRRAAVMSLKGLARDYTLEVGTKAMPGLISVLMNDRMDVEIVKAALETISILCTRERSEDFYKPQKPGNSDILNAPGQDSRDLGVMFTEIYLKDASNVALLLDILEETEIYVRFNTVQLLSTLLHNRPDRVKECVFVSPGGIARLMDLLDDRREYVRNEGLLLLVALTHNHAEIQKVVAFENAFDRLFGLVLEEGAAEGGVVVQDCLTLILNLLRYNISNQNLFRESSCIQRIPSLLLSHSASEAGPVPLTHESNSWEEQKIVNTVSILELIRILVGINNPNTTMNQNIMNQAHIINLVIDMAVSDIVPYKVKSQSLFTAGDIIRANVKNQDLFSKYVVAPNSPEKFPRPALLVLVEIALNPDEHFSTRAGGAYCFQCLLDSNADMQLNIAATLTPPPRDNDGNLSDQPQTPGSLIVLSLLDTDLGKRDPYTPWFASLLLSHVLYENQKCKELALLVRLGDDGGDDVALLHKVMYAVLVATRDGLDPRVGVGYLCLVVHWLHSSVTSVKEFLSEGSNLQFLIEQVNQSSGVSPLVQGLAAFLLVICHEFNDDLEPAFTQASLQTLIVSRIGADIFVSRIERLKESKYFQKVSPFLLPSEQPKDSRTLPDVFFDATFVDLLKSTYEPMLKAIINPKAKAKKDASGGSGGIASASAPSESVIESYKSLISTQDKEIQRLKKLLAGHEAKYTQELDGLKAESRIMSDQLSKAEEALMRQLENYEALQKEQEDLLVCLAESDLTMKQMRDRLRGYGEVIESEEEEEDDDDDVNGGEGEPSLV